MKSILTKFIPFKKMRYPSCGDYWEKGGAIQFRIVKTKKWEYEALIFCHEVIEYFLVKKAKISLKEIDEFDKNMEENKLGFYWHEIKLSKGEYAGLKCYGEECLKNKKMIGLLNESEPGICARAPYHKQHMFAMKIEKLLAITLGVNWKEYSDYIDSL